MEFQLDEEVLGVEPANSSLKKVPSISRKLSDEGIAMPKPCLKRRSSAPARPEALVAAGNNNCTGATTAFPRHRGGSCDSLDDRDSCYGSSCASSCLSGDDGTCSRKSVSFADSVGEDLCHIKVRVASFLVATSLPMK